MSKRLKFIGLRVDEETHGKMRERANAEGKTVTELVLGSLQGAPAAASSSSKPAAARLCCKPPLPSFNVDDLGDDALRGDNGALQR